MNRDVIALSAEFLERSRMARLFCDPPGAVYREVGIVAVDLHAERNRRIRDFRADGAEADDAELFAADFRADKLLFPLLGKFCDIRLAFLFPQPFDRREHIARGEQKAAEHKLLDAVCIGPGGIKDDNAFLGKAL